MLALAIAGLFNPSSAFAAAGDLYVTDSATGSVIRYEPDGTPNTFASGLVDPQGITFDEGNATTASYFYVADKGDGGATSGIVYRFDRDGNRTTFFSGLDNPVGVAADGSDIIVSENGANRIRRIPIDGSASTISLIVTNPLGLDASAFDQSGFLTKFVATGDSVFRADPGQLPVDIDPDDVSRSVGVDPVAKDVYVTTEAGTVSKMEPDGTNKTTFATGNGLINPRGLAFVPSGVPGTLPGVYVADPDANTVFRIPTNGIPVVFVTGVTPQFLVFENIAGPDPVPTPTPTPSPTPSATPTPSPKALNISTRLDVQTGDNVAIGGFIITGGTTPKTVIVRAIGPSLANANPPVVGALQNPVLELHDSTGATIAMNDNWKTNTLADRQTIISVGLDQFNGSPISDAEAVLVASLEPRDDTVPNSGAYTAVVSGFNSNTGVGLVEVYDLDAASAEAELANISTRGFVGTGDDVLIGGVIVGPTGVPSATVVVRAIGPSLGVATPPVVGALADPFIELHNSDGDIIATNDNWMDGDDEAEITALGLAPSEDAESALLANLIAGNYTALVKGVGDTTGVALVEVFNVTAP
jgi:hypothetical protein